MVETSTRRNQIDLLMKHTNFDDAPEPTDLFTHRPLKYDYDSPADQECYNNRWDVFQYYTYNDIEACYKIFSGSTEQEAKEAISHSGE